jgi:hypothetical protein
MASPVLDLGATVTCAHGGEANPTKASSRVTAAGKPVVTLAAEYVVSGCRFLPPLGNGPCVTGRWITGAKRVTSEGQTVAVMSGTGICEPTGGALKAVNADGRVKAS